MNVTLTTDMLTFVSTTLHLSYITSLMQDILQPNDRLLYYSDHNNDIIAAISSFPKYTYNVSVFNNLKSKLIYGKMDVYFLHFDMYNFSLTFDQLSEMHSWNSRGKFIIYLNSLNNFIWNKLYNALLDKYIYNMIVVTKNQVITYNPYKYEDFNNPNTDYEEITDDLYF